MPGGMEEDEIRTLLERHGVSTWDFGKGGALQVSDLVREVRQGLCSIGVDEVGVLIRHVSLVEVSLVACLPACRLVLVEEEQVLDDGRRRSRPQSHQKLHAKLRRGEAPVAAARRALIDRLALRDLSAAAVMTLPAISMSASGGKGGGTGEAICTSEAVEFYEAPSESYPGLRTHYSVHRVELRLQINESARTRIERQVTDPERDALMTQLALPMGRSFLTVEGTIGAGNGGRVHLWRWALAEMDQDPRRLSDVTSDFTAEDLENLETEEEPHEDGQEELTPLEQADRDVRLVLRILEGQRAMLYERGGHLESQLASAQDRLRRVLRKFSNVEALVSIDTSQLFTARSPNKNGRVSKSLLRFIKGNFAGPSNDSEVMASPQPPGAAEGSEAGGSSPMEEGQLGTMSEVEMLRQRGADKCWVLDVLELHMRTGRRSLPAIAELLVIPGAAHLGSSEHVMRRFTSAIHAKYEENPNPFHNEAHASLVCHFTHWLAVRGKAFSHPNSPSFQVATDIAALSHDVGHFGRNNLFCMNSGNALALTYNDRSILENMHAATCFNIMREPGCNVLQGTTPEQRKKYREHMVDLILATDMSSHFDFLGKFRLRLQSPDFAPQENIDDRRLVERCYLKAADLGHAALPWEMHEKWALRLLTEFYEQGDEEQSLGVPVSPLCERTGNPHEFGDSQKGFLQFVILPLFKELSFVTSPEVGETCITRLEVNAEDWVKMKPSAELEAIVKGEPRQYSPKRRGSNSSVSPPGKPKPPKEVTFQMPPAKKQAEEQRSEDAGAA